jgi:hypothetical protein
LREHWPMANDTDRHSSERIEPQTIDGATGTVVPTPGAFGKNGRRIDLSNLRDVRIELARLYRMMDAGDVTDAAGGKRAFLLKTLGEVIYHSEVEKRVDELEERVLGAGVGTRALPARTH